MPPDSRKTLIVKCVIAQRRIQSVSFLPTYINKQSQPEVLVSADPRFGEVLAYVEQITRDQGLDTRFTVQREQVVIHE